jgi:hypothetical protein
LNKYYEETQMTLLEQTYTGLRQAGLVGTAEAFSTNYLGKNKNWYALQAHYGRDFSVRAAVGCVRSLELAQGSTGLNAAQQSMLQHLAAHLHQHLATQYGVAALH